MNEEPSNEEVVGETQQEEEQAEEPTPTEESPKEASPKPKRVPFTYISWSVIGCNTLQKHNIKCEIPQGEVVGWVKSVIFKTKVKGLQNVQRH